MGEPDMQMALIQLREWEKIAESWILIDWHDGYKRCGECKQAIMRNVDPNGTGYNYSPDQILALTVAHIRQAHSEVINASH